MKIEDYIESYQALCRQAAPDHAPQLDKLFEADIPAWFGIWFRGIFRSIENPFLSDNRKEELPQYNRLLCDINLQELVDRAATAYGVSIDHLRKVRRISSDDKDKRDMLIY